MGDSILNQKVGRRIAKLRKIAGLKQWQLAQKSGFSKKYVSRVERGVSAASVKRLHNIATALGVPLQALFDFDGEQETKEVIEEITLSKKDEDGKRIEEKYRVSKRNK